MREGDTAILLMTSLPHHGKQPVKIDGL